MQNAQDPAERLTQHYQTSKSSRTYAGAEALHIPRAEPGFDHDGHP